MKTTETAGVKAAETTAVSSASKAKHQECGDSDRR
jgi:hypothetical protein